MMPLIHPAKIFDLLVLHIPVLSYIEPNNYPLSIQFVVSVIKLQNNIRKLPAESIKFLQKFRNIKCTVFSTLAQDSIQLPNKFMSQIY